MLIFELIINNESMDYRMNKFSDREAWKSVFGDYKDCVFYQEGVWDAYIKVWKDFKPYMKLKLNYHCDLVWERL